MMFNGDVRFDVGVSFDCLGEHSPRWTNRKAIISLRRGTRAVLSDSSSRLSKRSASATGQRRRIHDSGPTGNLSGNMRWTRRSIRISVGYHSRDGSGTGEERRNFGLRLST